jgi:tRNA A37 threonylcarbamoyladenosine biosynthesis protein TsaE
MYSNRHKFGGVKQVFLEGDYGLGKTLLAEYMLEHFTDCSVLVSIN